MKGNDQAKHKVSFSEARGIFLVILAVLALVFYYSWWFTEGRLTSLWLVAGLVIAIVYGAFQLAGTWLVYLATHYRPDFSRKLDPSLTVDVFVTACGEGHTLIERCLSAACNMRGQHKTWLLDDGEDPALQNMARRLGAGYLVRPDRKDAKAGNLNAALEKTDGDIVVIFDIDHAPRPDFLQRTLSYFADPKIGFVQVMLTFENNVKGWVARAASESALDFYNPTSIGADGLGSATLVGSNALIRREALEAIGGYKPGLAEDLATSIAIHGHGWQSAYVPEPLAPGYAPPDLTAWFTQQLKWARGVFELLLTAYPRYFTQLNWGQRVSYGVRMTFYWIGGIAGLHLLITLWVLLQAQPEQMAGLQSYLIHLVPLAFMAGSIRQLALRRWRHQSISHSLQWRAVALVYATWPIYSLAWLMAMLRVPLAFRLTPKTQSGKLNPIWLLPQIMVTGLMIAGAGLSASVLLWQNYWLVYAFAVAQILCHFLMFGLGIKLSMDRAIGMGGRIFRQSA